MVCNQIISCDMVSVEGDLSKVISVGVRDQTKIYPRSTKIMSVSVKVNKKATAINPNQETINKHRFKGDHHQAKAAKISLDRTTKQPRQFQNDQNQQEFGRKCMLCHFM